MAVTGRRYRSKHLSQIFGDHCHGVNGVGVNDDQGYDVDGGHERVS